ncbi:MAG: hypothetical protein HY001_03385 [Candidatus Portnoybacteria bacterium]|nr:hypothetical protein [Candidatus Portnoybacteria bacterium]
MEVNKFYLWSVIVLATLVTVFIINLKFCEDDWCFVVEWQKIKNTNNFDECESRDFPVLETYPRVCHAEDKTFIENVGNKPFLSDNVIITQPLLNTSVKSPIFIKGLAKGIWFFEASFPVTVVDANGQILGGGIAQATADWMTTGFVPFDATVTFKTPTISTGYLIFAKDNPSGLPEHDNEEKMPINF